MVDSSPLLQAPPSNTGKDSPKSVSTWSAVVEEGLPDKLADGMTRGPVVLSNSKVRG